ncbi:MAG: DUF4911 domain-containing protein [Desulfobacteraceae bacterium]|jgi:hypothetical protein
MKTTRQLFRLDRSEIAFVKFIFEAYDGIANLTTLDRQMGIVRLTIAPGCERLTLDIIEDLKQNMRIEQWRSISTEF